MPRPATPGWGVGACVCLCARPACFPPFLDGLCCVGVRAGRGSRLCPHLLRWVVGVCVRSCVCSVCPRPSWGAACGAGTCGCCPFFFLLGGGRVLSWLCGVGRWLSRSWASWSPHPLSSGLCFFFPSERGVCLRVLAVPFPGGRCSWLGVAGFGWVVLLCPFGGSCLWCCPGGGFGRLLPCWWAVWWLWANLVPPPPLLSFLGGVRLFRPLLSLGWRTHWSAFSVVFRVAVGGCVLPGCAPAPWVGWVMYTLGSVPLLAGLGSGSAGRAAAPGGFVCPWVRRAGVFRVLSPPRCRFSLSGGGLCGWTATVVAGRAVAPYQCVAGWCGSFRGVRWLVLVRPLVSVPCFGVVVCCRALCCAVPCRGVPLFAVSRRVVLWRVVLWGVLSWCVAPEAPPDRPHGAAAAAPADRSEASGTPPARGTGPARAQGASPGQPPGAAGAATEGREGAKHRAHMQPSHTHVSTPKPYPPKADLPGGRPRPVRAPTPKRTLIGITLPQLQRRVVQAGHEAAGGHGGDGDRTGQLAKHGGTGQGKEGNHGKAAGGRGGGKAPGTSTGTSGSLGGQA